MVRWTSDKLAGYGASIFASLGGRAVALNSINFGQGFPDFDGPEEVKEAAIKAMHDAKNQYAPLPGVPKLTQAISEKYEEEFGISFDPANEITVLNGATEAMYATINAICNPGDEFIVFTPVYDTYMPCVEIAGGVIKTVPLQAPGFTFDPDRLRAAFSEKTRAIIINTPHNPTGKVFTKAELEQIRDLCLEFDVIAICDEVYEYLVWDDHKHLSIATMEGMRERTVIISSTAKTYSMTGWKIGWTIAPKGATSAIRRMHQYIAFAVATPFQWGMAEAIKQRHKLIPPLVEDLGKKRNQICDGLEKLGFNVVRPQGTFFNLADFSAFSDAHDLDYAYQLLESEACVGTIPISVFIPDEEDKFYNYLRFCFAKSDDLIQRGLERLGTLKKVNA